MNEEMDNACEKNLKASWFFPLLKSDEVRLVQVKVLLYQYEENGMEEMNFKNFCVSVIFLNVFCPFY